MNRFHLHRDATPCATLDKHAYVATIAIQIKQIGEQMHDTKRLLLEHASFGLMRIGTRNPLLAALWLGITRCWVGGHRLIGACHQGRTHCGERGVVGNSVEIPFGGQLQRNIHHFVDAIDRLGIDACILQAQLQIVLADAASKHHNVFLAGQLFEVTVPNPGNIAAVGFIVVDKECRNLLARRLRNEFHVLVKACRVLRQI